MQEYRRQNESERLTLRVQIILYSVPAFYARECRK